MLGLGLWRQSGSQDGSHFGLLLLDEAAEGEGKTEVREGSGIIKSMMKGLKFDRVGWLRLWLLLFTAKIKKYFIFYSFLCVLNNKSIKFSLFIASINTLV